MSPPFHRMPFRSGDSAFSLDPATPHAVAQSPQRKTVFGFSLLELLVVMAIMAILLTMTMAVGPGLLKSTAMSSSLSSVASAVSLARSEAIRTRKQTYFVLAPDSGTLDGRSYTSYAVIRQEDASGTNYRYVTPWKKLPTGVLFNPTNSLTPLASVTNLPYPNENGSAQTMRVISFVSDGSLDEDLHPQMPVLPLQVGTRLTATELPAYQGQSITNQITVQRLSGKVKVVRAGDK